MRTGKGQQAVIVYHFFAHYRSAVMQELLDSTEHRYFLAGDTHDIDGHIKEWEVSDESRFIHAPCRRRIGLLFQRNLLRLACSRQFDTVIYLGNANWPSTWLSAILARLTGKRVLFWTHGWIHRDQGVRRWIRHIFYKLSHGLLLYGHMAKIIGMQEGFPAHRLHVIYNSLDYEAQKRARAAVSLEQIRQTRAELFRQPDNPLVICTSRLTGVRRLDQLIDALRLLRDRGHELNLLLVGDGPEEAALRKQANDARVPVCFFGPCYDEEVLARLVMSANVTVAPGKVGLTAMHSLAFGTPVLTHNDFENQMPEWEAIIPGKTGDLFAHNDVDGLAVLIEKWTQTSYPDEHVRQHCYEIIERFYNPQFQRMAIDRAVSGHGADDLFWSKPAVDQKG